MEEPVKLLPFPLSDTWPVLPETVVASADATAEQQRVQGGGAAVVAASAEIKDTGDGELTAAGLGFL